MVESVIIPDAKDEGSSLPGEPLKPLEPMEAQADAGADDGSESLEEADSQPSTGAAQALQDGAPLAGGESTMAPPTGDPRVPSWDDTTQQGAGQPPFDGEEAQDEVPSLIMILEKPALALEGIKIGIDPGHQARGNSERETVAPNSSETKAKVSSGATGVSTRIPEYITTLEISLKLREALEEQGAEVYMTRETHEVNISNQERAKMMNAAGVDLMLRIHCDSVNSSSKRGLALYCSKSNSIAEESYRAAEAILPEVCAVTGAKANGIVVNDNYTGQNWATVPCIMVECGFASNPEEDRLLNSDDYQWKLAEGLTQGIIAYIEARDG